MPHRPSAYLTAALRSHLIHAAVTEKNASDLLFLLEELALEAPAGRTVSDMVEHFQTCLARLARQPEHEQILLRCCEGLAQFCLLAGPEALQQLQQINAFLPEGLAFSLKSGRLVIEPERFNAPDNPFWQESLRLVAELPVSPAAKRPESVTPGVPESAPVQPTRIPEPPPEPPEDRHQQRQRIVQQRIHRLKHQLTGRSGL
jgi:hypothetical protein